MVDATSKLVREAKVGSKPECLVGYFDQLDFPVERIGLEAGPLSQWIYAALVAAGHEVVLLETRHVKAAMTVKTDRKDAPIESSVILSVAPNHGGITDEQWYGDWRSRLA